MTIVPNHSTDELDEIEVRLSRVAIVGGVPSREQLVLTQRRKDLLAAAAGVVREIPKFLPARAPRLPVGQPLEI